MAFNRFQFSTSRDDKNRGRYCSLVLDITDILILSFYYIFLSLCIFIRSYNKKGEKNDIITAVAIIINGIRAGVKGRIRGETRSVKTKNGSINVNIIYKFLFLKKYHLCVSLILIVLVASYILLTSRLK
ncbi:hypothetical protein CDIK_2947 [Cucumispora dikerogammari]|nr:hypothetical protein CDIK_2947 [Cucumispora dikerogammari]